MTAGAWRMVLTGLALPFLVLAAWAGFSADSFADTVADFGSTNAHLVHDFAAGSATVGFGLLLPIRVPSWRTPVLAVATLWNGLHTVSHLVDIAVAEPSWLGPIEAASSATATALLASLTRLSAKEGS
jgi:hypothetical protein